MAEKRYAMEGPARPTSLSEDQVVALTTGRSTLDSVAGRQVEAHARPVRIEEREVAARAAGQAVDLQAISTARRQATADEHARPRVLSEKDVEALAAGKRIVLEERDTLPPHS
jgi:hypothetical protein